MAKSKGHGRLIFLLAIIVAAAGGGGYYFYARGVKQPVYSTAKVTRTTIVQTISATGSLQTTSQVTISSQVSGNVIAINADFNDRVTKGQWLLKIDPSTYQQKLRQAQADLESVRANTVKTRGDMSRSKDLFAKNLLTQADLDTAVAALAVAESTLTGREAAFENAQTDLNRCTIYSPIEGVVLNRTTDVGGTVNVNQSAIPLYTLINDLTRLQISADVSEADIGNVQEKQVVHFSVDAYLNRTFQGVVSQVRNFAKNTSGVVTFSVIIDVDNSNLLLKPGMTATANIVIAERPNVLAVANNALRVRVPPELLPKTSAANLIGVTTASRSVRMTDEERRTAIREVMKSAGVEAGSPPTPGIIEKAKKLAADRGLDSTLIGQMVDRYANRVSGGSGSAASGTEQDSHLADRTGRDGVGLPQVSTRAVMNISNQRTLYKLVLDAAGSPHPELVIAHLGISDGSTTQIVDGVAEGDTLITYVTMPGATVPIAPTVQANPFSGRGGGRSGF